MTNTCRLTANEHLKKYRGEKVTIDLTGKGIPLARSR